MFEASSTFLTMDQQTHISCFHPEKFANSKLILYFFLNEVKKQKITVSVKVSEFDDFQTGILI